MPEVSRFYGILIAIYFRDHAPPHFHVRYAGQHAEVGIRDGRILAGSLAPRVQRLVSEWHGLHQAELLVDWDLAARGLPLIRIAPLD